MNRLRAWHYWVIWFGLLFLFSLPALSPLFTTAPTASADGLLHLYRLVQLDTLWREDVFFSRWLPDLAYGYGMPLFNYYAPLVYYLTTPLHIFGMPFTAALNVSLAAALFAGAFGMFCLTRALIEFGIENVFAPDIKGNTNPTAQKNNRSMVLSEPWIAFAALLAALAYLYAPYVLFNALYRANLAEQWALALAPFALWRFIRLVQKPSAVNWSLAVLAFAAVMLSHNVTSFLFAPLLLFYILACGFANARSLTFYVLRSSFLIPISALIAAFALSSFFWLPALLERDFVQIARVIVTPDFDYRFNFVSPLELIALLPHADTGRLNPAFPSTLGVPQISLTLIGMAWLVTRRRQRRALPFFVLGVATFVLVILMLSVSQPIWDSVSLLAFVQLPMRLRGLVALGIAPLAGVAIFILAERWRILGALIVMSLVVLSGFSLLYPRDMQDVPLNPTLSDMFAYEQRTGTFGTTSFGEYLPSWVQTLPDKSPFDDAYVRNEIPNRLVVPEGVEVCGVASTPITQSTCVTANDEWHAIYRAFYFPGWQVLIAGQPVAIAPTPRTGLISFEVKNAQDITVRYTGTDIEHTADWISIASAFLVAAVLVFGIVNSLRHPSFKLESPPLNLQGLLPLAFVALALISFKTLYVDHVSDPFVTHYDGTSIPAVTNVRETRFGDQIEMFGFDNVSSNVKRGDTVHVTLYWRALAPLPVNLSTFVHLAASDGQIAAQKDNLHPANLPTSHWDLDGYVADEHAFEIPQTLAPGDYELQVGVYDPRTNARLKTETGADSILLQTIQVTQ